MSNCLSRPCMQRLHQLMEIDFVLYELLLYLDTHPDDSKALREFCAMAERHHRMMMEYQENCAILMAFHCKDELPWQWIEQPWPWEIEY